MLFFHRKKTKKEPQKPKIKKSEQFEESKEQAKIDTKEQVKVKKPVSVKTVLKKRVLKKRFLGSGQASKYLIRPIITEKAVNNQQYNQYTFEVAVDANKVEIKKAIEELYQVQPIRVNIIRRQGKQVRYGRSMGRTKKWKKAIVFLYPGDKIEFVKK